jgi:UDP-N-acetyl-D-mannosaminuronic acid dehydrogenase
MSYSRDVVIVGGCGRVGFPLGLALADRGCTVTLFDLNEESIHRIENGILPFQEPGADEIFARVRGANLKATSDPRCISEAEALIVVIGTPIDEHLNPDSRAVPRVIESIIPYLVKGQLLVLRSTVYPGSTGLVERLLDHAKVEVDVAFCPERIAQGRALTELFELPQIVAARSPNAQARAEKLFRRLTDEIVHLNPEEAELAKLFTNVWRYIKFATANQLFIMANDFGLDYERIRKALIYGYPRAADLPSAGFVAGPCLFKDTMQLAAFNNNNFTLGHASMIVNEGLPLYVVSKLEQRFDLAGLSVGILGMAFKRDSDDPRSSLSYKLKRILRFKASDVLTTDPYVRDTELLPLDEVIERSDILIVGAPHSIYEGLTTKKPVIDIWNLLGQGVRV